MAYTSSDAATIEENLKVEQIPHLHVELSTLGGVDRATIIIKISLDDKDTWVNGIYHNSRYSMFHLNGGKLEQFSRNHKLPKFRKATIKSVDDVANKILNWVNKV
jgi:hypothetical protein